jgi:hypothetical protein
MKNSYHLTDTQANLIKDLLKITTEVQIYRLAKRNNIDTAKVENEFDNIFVALGNGRVIVDDSDNDNFDLEMETKYGSDPDEITGSD